MTPLLLVTGFLGSGKTTFLKNTVAAANSAGVRLALVINEYGAVDVDGAILRSESAEVLASVAGGCACCSGQDEFVEVIAELGARPPRSRPHAIVVEASGLADAALLLETISSPALLSLMRPQTVVSVVDALRWREVLDRAGDLVRRQVALADFLLVNKADQAPSGVAEALVEQLREANQRAVVLPTSFADFDFELLWPKLLGPEVRSFSGLESGEPGHLTAHAMVCPVPHPVDKSSLESAFDALTEDVWRAKGFIRVRGIPGVQLLQYTGGPDRHFRLAPFYLPHGMEEPELQLVFLGAALDEPELRRTFNGRVLSPW